MNLLIVTGIEGAQNCAEVVSKQLGMKVEIAKCRRAALNVLRDREFAAIVVDESLAECDPAGADAIWQRSGLAIPMQVNFAISGTARIIRDIRAALNRREKEQAVACVAARKGIENELKQTINGLLLQSQLALSQTDATTTLAERLRVVADLAGTLRQQLSAPQPANTGAPTLSHQ